VIPEGFALAAYQFSLALDPEVMVTTIGTEMGVSADWQDRADVLADDFIAGFPAANILVGYSFLGVKLYAGHGAGPTTIYEAPRNIVGTNAGPPMPSNCAFLVRKRTASAGRAHQGRMYFPACLLGEDSVNPNGVMGGAQVAVIQGRIDAALLGDYFVILHDELTPGGLAPTPINNLIVDSQIATQRRRMRN
jgi:hypothetical protein